MTQFLDFENFSWGVVATLFGVVLLLGGVFGFSTLLNVEQNFIPLYALLGFSFALVLLETGILIYMHGVNSGTFHKEERRKNLILKLNSIKNAREDVEEGFMHREMDKDSRDQMLRDLKQKELEVKNQLETLQDGNLELDGGKN